jgi:hypothetical protein
MINIFSDFDKDDIEQAILVFFVVFKMSVNFVSIKTVFYKRGITL